MAIISKDIERAAAILKAGEVIGFPTETVYGLAANAFDEKAIRKIYQLKNRPANNPLIVHIASPDQLPSIVKKIPAKATKLAEKFWPGPLTLLLPKKEEVPSIVTAGKPTVAVRIPDHPTALSLLQHINFPLVAPSANPSNAVSPTTAQHVADYFEGQIELVLDGGICKKGVESTIIGFEGEQAVLYRFGAIAVEDIEALIGPLKIMNKEQSAPQAPGMLLRHYSPATPFCFTDDPVAVINANPKKHLGLIRFREPLKMIPHESVQQKILSPGGSLEEAAAKLYATMIEMDKSGFDLIIAERFPDEDLGKTLNDRLSRAHNI